MIFEKKIKRTVLPQEKSVQKSNVRKIYFEIKFDPEEKALQLTKIEVEGLEATKLPEKYEPALTILSTVLARKYLEGHQIYQLKDRDLKDKTVRYLMKDIRIKDETLLIRLGL